ncbi:glycosyltransferase [Paenibacillus sp. PK3_47]|uniref:glycosyltransferase n=1 Tax=Paenibacillus sp. PK3_47 TaxID=2072642 RepID=UPI00201D6721|nr:glycosyltransferase [Paenibacillus sp. PK3_47]
MNKIGRFYRLLLKIFKVLFNKNRTKAALRKASAVLKRFGWVGLVKAIKNKASNRQLLEGLVDFGEEAMEELPYTGSEFVAGDNTGRKIFRQQQEEYPQGIIAQMAAALQKKIRFSIVILLERADVSLLRKTLKSIQAQVYGEWEIWVVDTGSKDRRSLNFLIGEAQRDNRINIIEQDGRQTDKVDAYNKVLNNASGEFVFFMHSGDQLTFDALYWAACNINENEGTKLLFSDECYINESSDIFRFFFKPAWSPMLMITSAYPGNFSVFEKKTLQECGGFNTDSYHSSIFETTLRLSKYKGDIQHVERILYLTYAMEKTMEARSRELASQANALSKHMSEMHYPAIVYERDGHNFISMSRSEAPLVSIIISTDHKATIMNRLLQLLRDTAYPNIEIIIVTNSGLTEQIGQLLTGLGERLVLCPYDGTYNVSRKYNLGAQRASGEYLVFLRDNMYVAQRDWLNHLLNTLDYPGVGAVSPTVINPEGRIVYAGGTIGQQSGELFWSGFAGQSFYTKDERELTIHMGREVHALSSFCFSVRKDVFFQVGGLNERDTPNSYNDLDFSFRIQNVNLNCAFVSTSVLFAEETLNIKDVIPRDRSYIYMIKHWNTKLKKDNFFSKSMLKYITESDLVFNQLYLPEKMPQGEKGNILLVSHELSRTGSPQVVFEAAKVLKNTGYFPVVASPEDGPLSKDIFEEGIPVIIDRDLAKYRAYRPNEVPKTISPGIDNMLSAFDLVLAASIVSHNLINCYNGSDIRILWWIHDGSTGLDLLKRYLPQKLNSNISVYCGGKYAQEVLARCRQGYNSEVLLYGVKDRATLEEEKELSEKILFLFPATFETRKNQKLLLEAVGMLPQAFAEKAEFLLLGKVNEEFYYQELQSKAKELPNVKISGPVPYSQLMNIYRETSCVVVPSIDDPLPVVLTEAMMMSKIVLCSDMTGTARYIEDGVNGFVFSCKSALELKQKIEFIISNFNALDKLRAAGRGTYEKYFSQEKFSVDLISVMEKNINRFAEENK